MDCQYIFLPLNEHYFIIQNILEHVSKLNNKRFLICELDCFLWKIIYYRNMSENKEEIGARIRLARKAAKLTQKELGKILGVGRIDLSYTSNKAFFARAVLSVIL